MKRIIEIHDLRKTYRRGGERIDVLDHIDLIVEEGGYLALMGPSGSGKTTLLNMIGGLDVPTQGSVNVCGVDIAKLKGRALASWRSQNIGFVFQFYNLMDVLSATQRRVAPVIDQALQERAAKARTDGA